MTDIERAIEKARELEAKATAGPWKDEGSAFSMPCGAIWHLWSTPYNGNPEVYARERKNSELIVFDRNTHKLVWDVVANFVEFMRYTDECGDFSNGVTDGDRTYIDEGNILYGKRRGAAIKDLDALARAVNGGE